MQTYARAHTHNLQPARRLTLGAAGAVAGGEEGQAGVLAAQPQPEELRAVQRRRRRLPGPSESAIRVGGSGGTREGESDSEECPIRVGRPSQDEGVIHAAPQATPRPGSARRVQRPVRPRTDRPGDVGRPRGGRLVGRCGGREAASTRGQLLIQPEKLCKCQPLMQTEKLCLNSARGAAPTRGGGEARGRLRLAGTGLWFGDSDGCGSPGLGWPPPGAGGKGRPGLSGSRASRRAKGEGPEPALSSLSLRVARERERRHVAEGEG